MNRPLRWALIGDGESPHLLKWARALAPRTELWVASSRGLLPELAALVPAPRQLALNTRPRFDGGNVGLLRKLPRLGEWLARCDADWINPHYLSSHGTLAWLARAGWRLRGQLLASAWGSDILVAPQRGQVMAWATARVLRAAALSTSDSQHMAQTMQALGAGPVEVFPFGLDALPAPASNKQPWLFFSNRALEPNYRPQRVLDCFAAVVRARPQARLVVANDGSLRPALQQWVAQQGLVDQVQFTGRLDHNAQNEYYQAAQWYLSLPVSDSVSVSVLEALAHGCLPLLSDLPANRELITHGRNGLILADAAWPAQSEMTALLNRAAAIAASNRAWVQAHALFEPCIERLLQRLRRLPAEGGSARP